MRTTLRKSVVAVYCSLFLSLNLLASSLEISGSYMGGYEFNADTLLVVGDCNFANITLEPGTFILFTGDYTITLDYLKSIGTETDSITFCGSLVGTLKQGRILDQHAVIWQTPPSTFTRSNLVNLKQIVLLYTEKCSILGCESASLSYPGLCNIQDNNTINFDSSVDSCLVTGNAAMYFNFNDTRFLPQQEFHCTNSKFLRNASGLRNSGSAAGLLYIENCEFSENEGTILTYHIDSYYYPRSANIQNNKFYRNTGNILDFDITGDEYLPGASISQNEFIENEGIAILSNNWRYLMVYNNLFAKNQTGSGPGSIYYYYGGNEKLVRIMNNTFVANQGETFGCLDIISDSTCTVDVIANNIFWDNRATLSDFAIGISFLNPPAEDCDLSITNSAARDTSKIVLFSGAGSGPALKNSFELSPEFADSLNNNYRLSKASPYIDAGEGAPGTEDLDGHQRIFGKAIDLGPYEYLPSGYPGFSSSTSDTLVCLSSAVTLKALSDDRYNYNWYKEGEWLEDQHDDSLRIRSLSLSDTGYYRAGINNLTDTVWSDPIHLTSASLPVIIDYTAEVEVCRNLEAAFIIETESELPPVYAWYSYRDGLVGEGTNELYIGRAEHSDTLLAIATTACGSDSTGKMLLRVLPLPVPDLGNDTMLFPGDSIRLDAGEF
ncbi:MAG: hypothetical protein JW801_02555, partial [Bacteroidales bacterium]|nr:hypothetical protein [Bacteroidales bacterium]